MKAQDLRIGNYYFGDVLNPNEFEVITPADLVEFYDDPLDDYYKPIPLTEEWLLKMGFAKEPDYDEDYGNLYSIDWWGGFFLKNGIAMPKHYYFADAFWEGHEIKYVHQIQNVFHALTGEELTIHPNT